MIKAGDMPKIMKIKLRKRTGIEFTENEHGKIFRLK